MRDWLLVYNEADCYLFIEAPGKSKRMYYKCSIYMSKGKAVAVFQSFCFVCKW